MTKAQQKTITTWFKRLLVFIAISLWMYVIYTISKSSTPFMEQIPYCMASTILIFGLLSALHKGFDYWSLRK